MTRERLKAIRERAHKAGFIAGMKASVRIVQAWVHGERQITRDLRREIEAVRKQRR